MLELVRNPEDRVFFCIKAHMIATLFLPWLPCSKDNGPAFGTGKEVHPLLIMTGTCFYDFHRICQCYSG